jgi:hypothetical protein
MDMSPIMLKRLVLYAALASWPAALLAQGMTGDTTSPQSPAQPSQTTKSTDASSDSMGYQKELAACDKQPAADQETCRSKVDQKYAKKSSPNTPPQSSPQSPGKSTY